MDNCDNLRPIIQLHDRPILKHLYDIRIKTSPLLLKEGEIFSSEKMGFRIEFYFHPNKYFENEVLYKVKLEFSFLVYKVYFSIL